MRVPSGLVGAPLYIVGDSLSSPVGNGGNVEIAITTDGAGTVTVADVVATPNSGFKRDFTITARDPNNAALVLINCTVNELGAISATAIDSQSGPFTPSLAAETQSQDYDRESWAYRLWNNYGMNGRIAAIPASSYSRPSTAYAYGAGPAPAGGIALIVLGGNDVGGIDIGGGLAPGGPPADTTAAELDAAVQALIGNFKTDGWRVIVVENALADFSLVADDDTWITGNTLVRETIQAAAAAQGITEVWPLETPLISDYVHPSQEGHDLIFETLYPAIVAVAGGGGGSQWDDVAGGISYAGGIVSGIVSDNSVNNPNSKLTTLTQAEYDALTPDADTIYFIVG